MINNTAVVSVRALGCRFVCVCVFFSCTILGVSFVHDHADFADYTPSVFLFVLLGFLSFLLTLLLSLFRFFFCLLLVALCRYIWCLFCFFVLYVAVEFAVAE